MKIVFVSNFLNHHQLPFCSKMYERCGTDFIFIATEKIPDDRIKLGYDDMNNIYPFIRRSYDGDNEFRKCIELANNSDVVIIGSAPNIFIDKRMKENKLTFKYSERIFKEGIHKIWHPNILYYLYKNHIIYKRKNLYMLCSSAYTAYDFSLVGVYKNKCYKWGYFPEVIKYNIDDIIKCKNNNNFIDMIWVGRLIKLKHPEKAIKVAYLLNNNDIKVKLHIIGIGPLENKIKKMINKYQLNENVVMVGSLNNKEVRNYMLKANIFLFTSDYNEGWGAVLNEAMNSGCAVVASHAIGSVPFLIKNNINGLIYKNNSLKSLYNCCCKLAKNKKLCSELGKNAYNDLNDTWNAEVASERLINLINIIKNNSENVYDNGPCSNAAIITQYKMYNYITKVGGKNE